MIALLRLQWLLLLRSGAESGPPPSGLLGLRKRAGLLIGFLVLGYLAYRWAASWVSSQGATGHVLSLLLALPVLTALGSAATILIFFYAFTNLIGTLTYNSDLRLLLLTPVPVRVVLAEKFLAASLRFSGILALTLPALFALGAGLHAGPAYYLAALVAVIILPLMPVALAALILLALLRWLPPSRARTVSTVTGTMIAAIFFVGSQFLGRRHAGTVPGLPPWLPTTWPGRFVAEVGVGHGSEALRYGLASLTLGGGLMVVAILLAAQLFAIGWANYGEHRRQPRHTGTVMIEQANALRFPASWPLLHKEWLTLRRDPQRLVALAYPLLVVAVNAYTVLSQHNSAVSLAITLYMMIIAAVLMVATSTPFVVNREGKALLLLALAPISTGRILAAKWIAAAIPSLVLVEVALAAIAVYTGLGAVHTLILLFAIGGLVIALTGAALVINVIWPKLDAVNRRGGSFVASIVSMVAEAVLGLGTGVLLTLGLSVWHGGLAVLAVFGAFALQAAVIAAAALAGPHALSRLLFGGALTRS